MVNPRERQRLQTLFERGRRIVQSGRNDFEAAQRAFAECVAADPGNLLYVEAMLQNLAAMHGDNQRGWWMGSALNFAKRAVRAEVRAENWAEALQLGPRALWPNPWDAELLRLLATACQQLRHHDVELRYLHNALVAHPGDLAVNRQSAKSFALQGQLSMAKRCWEQLRTQAPNDDEAGRFLEVLGCLEDERDLSNAPIEGDTERSVEDRLAEVARLVGDGRFQSAETLLREAAAMYPGDWDIRERAEELEVERKRHQRDLAQRLTEIEPSFLADELVVRLDEDLNRMELGMLDHRAQRYPEDETLRFQLGVRLKRAGMFHEAAAQFASVKDRSRSEALLELGECRQHLREFEPALDCYREAAANANEPGGRRRPLYRLGVLAEAMGRLDEAREAWQVLTSLDPDDKEAAERLDRIGQIRHKR